MKPYLLDRDAYFCEVDGGAIFLDLNREKYLAIDLLDFNLLARAVEGWPQLAGRNSDTAQNTEQRLAKLIGTLVHSGVLTETADRGKSAAQARITTTEALDGACAAIRRPVIRLHHVAGFIASLLTIKLALRVHGLKHILDRLHTTRRRRREDARASQIDTLALAAIFRRLRPWFYTSEDACLLDSLVLTTFLQRYRSAPTFVIGVRTKPFAAHAWVQLGEVVLNDTAEKVQTYTPLLVVPAG